MAFMILIRCGDDLAGSAVFELKWMDPMIDPIIQEEGYERTSPGRRK
jgi:hypothetical protein